jgi:hypothetical protein
VVLVCVVCTSNDVIYFYVTSAEVLPVLTAWKQSFYSCSIFFLSLLLIRGDWPREWCPDYLWDEIVCSAGTFRFDQLSVPRF